MLVPVLMMVLVLVPMECHGVVVAHLVHVVRLMGVMSRRWPVVLLVMVPDMGRKAMGRGHAKAVTARTLRRVMVVTRTVAAAAAAEWRRGVSPAWIGWQHGQAGQRPRLHAV